MVYKNAEGRSHNSARRGEGRENVLLLLVGRRTARKGCEISPIFVFGMGRTYFAPAENVARSPYNEFHATVGVYIIVPVAMGGSECG